MHKSTTKGADSDNKRCMNRQQKVHQGRKRQRVDFCVFGIYNMPNGTKQEGDGCREEQVGGVLGGTGQACC